MTGFLGSGWAFPVRLDADHGGVATSDGEQHVRESILMILETEPGERVMRPDFGCRIRELVFAPNDATTVAAACSSVWDALEQWEPRIDVLDVRPVSDEPDGGRISIEIDYRIRATNSVRNLVHGIAVEGT